MSCASQTERLFARDGIRQLISQPGNALPNGVPGIQHERDCADGRTAPLPTDADIDIDADTDTDIDIDTEAED
jgi:hypothetical protein